MGSLRRAAALAAIILAAVRAEDGESRFLPLRIGSYVDLGQIAKGYSDELLIDQGGKGSAGEIRNYFLSNIGVSLMQEVMRENLDVKIGVAGLFWYPYPNLAAESRIIKFGPGISEASFEYAFAKTTSFKFGFFPYKYNADARNLGEYLFRSECYPSFVKTGGWSWLDPAAVKTLGARFHFELFGGAWSHDLLVLSELDESPVWDFSPAYVTAFRAGPLEIGAGISLHRWLPIKPGDETPDAGANTYVEIQNFPALPQRYDTILVDDQGPVAPANIDAVVRTQDAFAGGTMKEMESHLMAFKDSTGAAMVVMQTDSSGRVYYLVQGKAYYPSVRERLTFQGVKLMGRASLDLKRYLHLPRLGPEDLRLYAEVAVLGVRDQPYYYEHVADRMPMMFGANLPTFGLLDILAVQFEYYRNPFPDSKEQSFKSSFPIWGLTPGGDNPATYREKAEAGLYREDDWKWSVNLSRTLTRGLLAQAQIANDHFRLRDDFTRPGVIPVTTRKGDWYYLARLQWGI